MNFNLAEMPAELHQDSIYLGIDCTLQQFRIKNPSDRAEIMQNRKARSEIVELAKQYFSHFSCCEFGEALQDKLIKLEDDTAEILFGIFAHMAIPLAAALGRGDLRNEGTINFFNEFSGLDFNSLEFQPMFILNTNAKCSMVDSFDKETKVLTTALKTLIEKHDLTYAMVANCFAKAFLATHSTIGQNYVRAMCRTAEVLGNNHFDKTPEITSPDLLWVIKAISNTEHRTFPYI